VSNTTQQNQHTHYHKHLIFMHLTMASHSLMSPSPLTSHSLLRSSFSGVSVKLSPQFSTLSRSSFKPLSVVAAAKKAVAVLKGNSTVEGVVTLTQESEGDPFSESRSIFHFRYQLLIIVWFFWLVKIEMNLMLQN